MLLEVVIWRNTSERALDPDELRDLGRRVFEAKVIFIGAVTGKVRHTLAAEGSVSAWVELDVKIPGVMLPEVWEKS